MARQFRSLILAAWSSGGALFAEDHPPASKPADAPSPPPRRPLVPEFGNVRRALEALTPEQRQRFIENLKRWSNLPPEEKKALADREGMRRKKIDEEVDRAISELGLTLDGERRVQFTKRYAEERKKLEEDLRKELEEKRKPLLNELAARLKKEFSSPPANPQ